MAVVTTLLPARSAAEKKKIENPKARIGLVFDVGGRGDKSFNDAAYEGLYRARAALETSDLPDTSTLAVLADRVIDRAIQIHGAAGRGRQA